MSENAWDMGMPFPSKRRSRRLRKKMHLGEFMVFGFCLHIEPATGLSIAQHNAFWDAFIADAIEAHGLTFGGNNEGFVVPEAGSATEQHRALVQAWLAARPDVANVVVGPLINAYPRFEKFPLIPWKCVTSARRRIPFGRHRRRG